MKILFIYYYPSGGVETLARQRSIALKNYGISFDFLYYWKGPGLQNIEGNRIFITNQDTEIQTIIENEKYDAIIVCSDHITIAKIRKFGYNGVLIYEIQGLGNLEEADYWFKGSVVNVTGSVNAILLPKTPHLTMLTQTYFPNLNYYSFHNCIDTKRFIYKSLPKLDYPVIGWVGRLEENKNWKGFLDIGSELFKVDPTIHLWMFMDYSIATVEEKTAFQKRVLELQLNKHLHVLDNVPHEKMPDYYSLIGDSGGLLLSTSKIEGFGYAVVEAMSCMCPVLSSDSDGIKSSIIHDKTGKIYSFNNIQAAVSEAKELLFNHSLRESIKQNALKHVHQHFSPAIYAKNFLEMLKSLGL
ncbi:glycosyltransferase family 4 protein [Peribacillus frigoritolerans]|uniref:glycosyltransferase family 4 protein n=1 Tax=Peribacillus frigoritolerans TaxID=450367 RepID=UPI0038136BC6